MPEIVFFSKTNWDETPRLRHQTAKLLKSFGEPIYFFQKPRFPWGGRSFAKPLEIEDDFFLARTTQLLHHQLRVGLGLGKINSLFEISSIKSVVKSLSPDPIIINFNYDYFFLREIFPKSKIITILNDDFVAQAKFFDGKHIYKSLKKTCEISNEVLVVSYPILKQVKSFCKPKIFFPWSDTEYIIPRQHTNRSKILLWSHIDGRVDFRLIENSAKKMPEVIFDLVGPVSKGVFFDFKKLCAENKNIVHIPPTKLDELDFDSYFCSIIPYKCSVADIEAVTISNKTFQLLARGMPIVTHGMPNFFEHPAISKSDTIESFLTEITRLREEFFSLQKSISDLVSSNNSKSRLAFLSSILFK